jgi:hypothetical protein
VTRRNVLFDVLVAGAVLVIGQLEVWTGAGSTHHQGPQWVQALAYAIGAVLLLARRVYPLWVLAGLVTVYVVEFATHGDPADDRVVPQQSPR